MFETKFTLTFTFKINQTTFFIAKFTFNFHVIYLQNNLGSDLGLGVDSNLGPRFSLDSGSRFRSKI